MKQADVVVLGGSAAGVTAAVTARRHYPDKSILIIRREAKAIIPCGIPYIFGTIKDPEEDLLPDSILEKNNIEIFISQAAGIDRVGKIVHTKDGDVRYDRLVLAIGSSPIIPRIKGAELDGTFAVYKDIEYLRRMQNRLQQANDIVIIGGGFIGIELGDEINKMGNKNVTIVEIMPHCLNAAYDEEFCVEMEEHLISRGLNIRTSIRVEEIRGNNHVESVLLSDGTELKADVVVFAIGAVSNVDIARSAGLRVGQKGSIYVDRTMMTSDPNIFACGDCAEKFSFFGWRASELKLASIATLEGRICGANLFGITRENPGTVGVWATSVGELALGTAGLTETMAKNLGYQTICGVVEGLNRHPAAMPGASKMKVKLVFEKNSETLLGGQVRGDNTAAEMINAISALVQRRLTAEDIAVFQMGTHPALTTSPVAYPLVNAAEIAISKKRSSSN
ncbi:MAG: FAD-dependent oxidoreductase [Planctomycetes bacterium]|nr:FAD-dependent oxidoreductase [Planctomycetota bacterium]